MDAQGKIMDVVLKDSSLLQTNTTSGARASSDGETVIGAYLLLLGWLSWLGNGAVICLMCKRRQHFDCQDIMTFNLAVSDGGISIFGYSRGIMELFQGFGKDGFLISSLWTCNVDGFLILLFGLISISTLTAISLLRYVKGCHPHRAHMLDQRCASVTIIIIWISAIIWSGAPLLGWGSFKERKYGTCEIDWSLATSSISYKCYVIGVFLWGFFIPVAIMIFCYVSIIRVVHASHRSSKGVEISKRQLTMERDITRVSFVICTAFLLAWSPYAVISMWSACGYQVPALTSVVATLLAKSASFYNPIIYIGLSPKFRQELQAMMCCFQTKKSLPSKCQKVAVVYEAKKMQSANLIQNSEELEGNTLVTNSSASQRTDMVEFPDVSEIGQTTDGIANVDTDITNNF
ncbi:opsin-5-like [Pyxicephalus adspersus]|uniref:opsin-5-like n=1 Tax=Pyxicephalus adspersus TaxID=30357 RepID=UPI003B5C4043